MDLEGRISRLEDGLRTVELKLDQILAQQGDTPFLESRHPDLIKRAQDATQSVTSGPPMDRRSKGACLAIAMVMAVLVIIAAITAMANLGNSLQNTFNQAQDATGTPK